MALPLILQAIGGGLLGQGLYDAYRNIGADKRRAGLLGTMPTPSTMTPIPPVGPPTAQGIMPESEGNVVTPGKPGSGLLGSLYGMNPQVAEQLAPLLQQMPGQDLQAVSRGLVGSAFEQPKQTQLMQNLAASGLQPGTPEYEKAMRDAIMKTQTSISIGGEPPYKIPTGFMMIDPARPDLGIRPIPGSAEERRSGEVGRQTALSAASRGTLQDVYKAFINDDGTVNREMVLSSGWNVPWTKGRTVRSQMEDVLANKLRLDTGAAQTDQEVKNILRRFEPSIFDTDAGIKDKFDRLMEFFNTHLSITDPALYRKLTANSESSSGNSRQATQSQPPAGSRRVP